MFIRYNDFLITKLTKLKLGREKVKCNRISDLLSSNKTSFGFNYNIVNGNRDLFDTINLEFCDEKYPLGSSGFAGPGRTRCRRLVDARINLNKNFDKNCTIKADAYKFKEVGGKKNKKGKTLLSQQSGKYTKSGGVYFNKSIYFWWYYKR
jgi:hypothetical protein